MSLEAVKMGIDCIIIDDHEMINNAIYTVSLNGIELMVRRKDNGKIYIFQTDDKRYQDPPCENEGNKPWA